MDPRGRGRGQARGRGRPNRNSNNTRPPRPRPEYQSVPAYAAIQPGTGVSIILKEDQQTGHQVKGIVADTLTRGDHPRGVKVRLRDGRVGRVQALASQAEGEQGEALVGGADAMLGRNGEGGRARMVGGRVERDVRENDEYFYDEGRRAEEVGSGYFAELEEADRRHREGMVGGGQLATCPVCGDFEGDEAAVAHHVESHFRD
jgi:uncharacterized repeat protein (TIGR03833 family)